MPLIVLGSDDALSSVQKRAWDKAKLSFRYPGFYGSPVTLDEIIGAFSWAVAFMVALDPATIVKEMRG